MDWLIFRKLAPPWCHILVEDNERNVDSLFVYQVPEDLGLCVRIRRGVRCQSLARNFQEFAAALQFPYYFNNNWGVFF
jgi:hypothetical protein